eukprot:8200081-Pyramimonas_sp.AAC.1
MCIRDRTSTMREKLWAAARAGENNNARDAIRRRARAAAYTHLAWNNTTQRARGNGRPRAAAPGYPA